MEAFQRAAHLAVDGKSATPSMLATLFASDAPRADGAAYAPLSATPEPTQVPASLTSSTLKYGTDNSEAVKQMQRRLEQLGYMKGTGGYWKSTKAAVAAFLQAAGMSGDGSEATPEMLALLYSSNAPMAPGKATPTPAPANTDTSSSSGGSATTTTTAAPSIYTLTYGMENDAGVRTMQMRLRELGFFNSNPTGNYYSVTKSAVEAFQKAAGLIVDGKVASAELQNRIYSSSAPSAYSGVATYTELRKDMMDNDEVRLMQRRLAALGYFDSKYITGNYLILTVRALEAFQAAAGLPVNGRVASAATLQALYGGTAPNQGSVNYPTPTATPAYATPVPEGYYTDLYYGAKDSGLVKDMQRRLRELGYLKDRADGTFGPNTQAAVVAFQKAAGLPENGSVATAAMQAALFAAGAPSVGNTAAPTQTGVTPTQAPATTSIPYQTLTYGMENNNLVKAMQDKLRLLGYFSETSTGNYYVQTRRAVAAFEKDRGNVVDGRTVSAELLSVILTGSATTPTPTATATPEPGATAVPTPTPTAIPYQTLTYGMENNSLIVTMQNRLRELGYFKDQSTGNYYNATKAAVKAFEAACGNTVDGKTASVSMLEKLFSASAPKYGSSPTSSSSDRYATLTYGMSYSQTVLDAQRRLVELGFQSTSTTFSYDDAMVTAVEAFQRYFNYAVDGKTLTGAQLELLFTSGTKEELMAIRNNNSGNTSTGTNDDSSANLRSTLKKGSSGSQVTLLTTRLIELGYLTGSPTSYYSDAVANAVMWFQNSNGLAPDGIAGNMTLTKIYTQSVLDAAGSYKAKPDIVPSETSGTAVTPSVSGIQTLAWSNSTYFDRKTGIFKDGATATVTDVKTGITYKVKRCGGYNHADVEPLTAYDTWQMFRIYNQKWAWDRHAVIVTFSNGVSSAASINGMPHGDSSITDNNMDGHTCIHFSGSLTPGTSNLDPDHQAAIQEAASTNLSELQEKINSQK